MGAFKQFLEAARGVADLQANNMFVVFRPDAPSVQSALDEPAPRVLFQLMSGNPRQINMGAKYLGEVELDMPHIGDDPYHDVAVYAVHSEAPDAAAGVWKGYNKRQDVQRGYGGPGYDMNAIHMTAPVKKRMEKLYQLSRLGLIVDPRGQPVDFTKYA